MEVPLSPTGLSALISADPLAPQLQLITHLSALLICCREHAVTYSYSKL